jgi:hypothetical protein
MSLEKGLTYHYYMLITTSRNDFPMNIITCYLIHYDNKFDTP